MPLVLPAVQLGPVVWDYSRTCLLGVLNVTPDSFSDGGCFLDPQRAIAHGRQLAAAGADVLDIGGESTRPGAQPVSAAEELARVAPVISGLRELGVPLSIDTYKASVAAWAVEHGASVINDVSGLRLDSAIAEVAARSGALLIIGHLRGRPETMQQQIAFADVVEEVADELRGAIRVAVKAGVRADRIWVDPCIGFGKDAEQSLQLLAATRWLRETLGYPVLVGPSRKSFIGAVTGQGPQDRLLGTCATAGALVALGADALRLHDVAELVPALRVVDAMCRRPQRERA